jgi:hypothetical protein
MKISKSLLSKIIKEEIKRVIYEDNTDDPPWAIDVINYIIDITNDGKSKNYDVDESDKCKNYIRKLTGKDAKDVLIHLTGKVDPQRLQMAADKMKLSGMDFGILPDPIPARSVDNDIRSSRERFDKKDDPRADPRTGEPRKNWVHEE